MNAYELYQDAKSDGATVIRMLLDLPSSIDGNSVSNYLFTLLNSPSVIFDPVFRGEYVISTPITSVLLQVPGWGVGDGWVIVALRTTGRHVRQ